jgi:hypothetical protein
MDFCGDRYIGISDASICLNSFGCIVAPACNILLVLLKDAVLVLPSSRRGNIILFFQPHDDFFGSSGTYLLALGVQVSQYLVQTHDSGLCTIDKP